MNLAQHRVFVGRYISNVVVHPPKNAKGKNTRDDSRLEVHYKDGTVERLSNPKKTVRYVVGGDGIDEISERQGFGKFKKVPQKP